MKQRKFKRAVIHHTAGGYNPSAIDLEKYHFLYDGTGKKHIGKYKPEDNLNTADNKYAPHVGGLNTGSIGYSLCCMGEDKNGKQLPLKRKPFEAMCADIAKDFRKYNMPVTINTVMTHYEVGQKVLKGEIERNDLTEENIGKIDINFIPWKPELKADQVGDYIRSTIIWYYNTLPEGI